MGLLVVPVRGMDHGGGLEALMDVGRRKGSRLDGMGAEEDSLPFY